MGDDNDCNPPRRERLHNIVMPHPHDVLSGRGNFVNQHWGNENFRRRIKSYKKAYMRCPKSGKGIYSKIIYEKIRAMSPPGRFLKQDPATKLWADIGEKRALHKTRQALREGAPSLMKEMGLVKRSGEGPVPVGGAAVSDARAVPQRGPPEGLGEALSPKPVKEMGLVKRSGEGPVPGGGAAGSDARAVPQRGPPEGRGEAPSPKPATAPDSPSVPIPRPAAAK